MPATDVFFEMANLGQKHTGLPFVVWISVRGGARHDVRVKVSQNLKATAGQLVSVAIRPEVRVVAGEMSASDLALLRQWIRLNEDVIVRYWNSEIDTLDALEEIRAI
jgi:hypothetical protein